MANRHEDSFIFNKIRMFLENCKFNDKLKIYFSKMNSVSAVGKCFSFLCCFVIKKCLTKLGELIPVVLSRKEMLYIYSFLRSLGTN